MNSWNRKTVCVLGAGNAGLFSAIYLKRSLPGLNVYVVGSSELGIVGVGESSTEHVMQFMNLLGVEHKEIVQQCGATFKYGVHFKDWVKEGEEYVHSLVSDTNEEGIDFDQLAGMSYGLSNIELLPPNYLEQRVDDKDSLPNQFHFDTQKLNKWLHKRCKMLGIAFYDDLITKINHDDGHVTSIESETTEYQAELFVDASGFKRLIANEISEFQYISKQDDMFVDSAFAFQCPHEGDNYPVFTTAQKMSAGWMWRIPTSERMGNGYAYSSKHISYEDAVKEVTEKLGFEPKVGKTFKFEAGHYNKTFHKNVVLIGLSSHFFEPLEATAIGVGLQQAKLLVKYINSTTPEAQQGYNAKIQQMFEQMFMFIRLHYVNCEVTSPFWQDVKNSVLPVNLQKLIDINNDRVLVCEDLGEPQGSDWRIFGSSNFNQVLWALGMLSQKNATDFIFAHGRMPKKYQFRDNATYKHKDLINKWNSEYENSTNN